MENYRFFQNRDCEFFPCHNGVKEENFNCLFCYCPLYPLGDACGGSFCYTSDGIKDCSQCCRPHIRENYDSILSQMAPVMQLAKKKEMDAEKP